MIERSIISRDDSIYEMAPDVALTQSGKLVCVFLECISHTDRSYSRTMITTSTNRGRTWTPKCPLSYELRRRSLKESTWDCPRISTLNDGRLCVVASRFSGAVGSNVGGEQTNWLWFSDDDGITWQGPSSTPIFGIVPDQILELKRGEHSGRWLTSTHIPGNSESGGPWQVLAWYSDDKGQTWQGPQTIAADPALKLCEGSLLEIQCNQIICFTRENSHEGLDCFKSISLDGGITWQGPYRMPVPGCHRPVSGHLQSGKILITYRFCQGGEGWLGWWAQNVFAAYTDVESCVATKRGQAHTRIFPLDFDRSPVSDCGYTGWVQFPDGEIYVVSYIVDDAPKAHIRGYRFREDDIVLS